MALRQAGFAGALEPNLGERTNETQRAMLGRLQSSLSPPFAAYLPEQKKGKRILLTYFRRLKIIAAAAAMITMTARPIAM